MILITGATGMVGGAVLEEVRKTKEKVRALYRNVDDAKKAPPDVEEVVGDFADKDSLKLALDVVDTVFLVCSPIPQLVELESNVIDACREHGVKHVVLNSALGAEDYAKSFPSWHRKVEDKLKSSGLKYTILRPNGFMQNVVTYNAPSIRSQGAFYAATGEAKISLIDVRDIAVVAAKILSEPEAHAGKTYELTGASAFSNAEVAERIARATGRPVKFVDIPEDAQRKAMLDMGMPDWQVTAILELQQFYRAGKAAQVTEVLPRLLGRAPRTLDRYLDETKESFRDKAAGA